MIRGLPVLQLHPGKVFHVNNSGVNLDKGISGDDNNSGSMLQPLATIDAAIGKCTANRGDIVLVAPGHSETISAAAAIDLDVAGVALIGMGSGNKMAQIVFSDAAASVAVGADNVSIFNMRMTASVTGITVGLDIEDGADHCAVKSCVFDVDAAGTDEFLISIRTNDASNNALIEDCRIDMGIAGAESGIAFVKDTAQTTVRDCVIRGDFSTANIKGVTTLSTNLLIEDNLLENGIGGDINAQPVIELLTGSTGTIRRNDILCDTADALAAIVADTCVLFDNKVADAIAAAAQNTDSFGRRVAVKTDVDLTSGNVDDVMTVSGGAVAVQAILLKITTAVSANASLLHFESDPTLGAGSNPISKAACAPDIASAALGDVFRTDGKSGAVAVKAANGSSIPVLMGQSTGEFMLDAGGIDIKLTTSDPTTGAATMYVIYTPLDPGARVS
jgi:hypothetical protein